MSMAIPELAEQEGITATTLYHWRKQARSVEAWRDACLNAKADAVQQDKQLRQAHKEEQKRLRKLERELRRKDKALAETAALLTLSKNRLGLAPALAEVDHAAE